ncbi:MAG: hypothetical protein AB7V55_04245, partial [Oscillospiraceae bacterium]
SSASVVNGASGVESSRVPPGKVSIGAFTPPPPCAPRPAFYNNKADTKTVPANGTITHKAPN